jgi:hypothetical protein
LPIDWTVVPCHSLMAHRFDLSLLRTTDTRTSSMSARSSSGETPASTDSLDRSSWTILEPGSRSKNVVVASRRGCSEEFIRYSFRRSGGYFVSPSNVTRSEPLNSPDRNHEVRRSSRPGHGEIRSTFGSVWQRWASSGGGPGAERLIRWPGRRHVRLHPCGHLRHSLRRPRARLAAGPAALSTRNRAAPDDRAAQAVGMAVVVGGGAIALWCILSFAVVGRGTPAPFDPPRRLVVGGPYAVVRNPRTTGLASVPASSGSGAQSARRRAARLRRGDAAMGALGDQHRPRARATAAWGASAASPRARGAPRA